MAYIYVWVLLGLFSCVNSHKLAEKYYGNYILEHWGSGEDTKSWCNAQHTCHLNGGELAMPTTSGLNNAITSLVRYSSSPRVWIGGSDMVSEQNWRWNDGTWFTDGYRNWDAGEPNDNKGEDCVEFFDVGLWNDEGCGDGKAYVCQTDLTKTTKSDFATLAFSDSFSGGSKSATLINEARTECENKGLKLIQNVKSSAIRNQIKMRLQKFPGAKYCIDNENHGKMMDATGMLDEECAGQPFLYICEGYRPHYMKVSDEAPVVDASGNIEIECTADGYPVPEVIWHKTHDHVITSDASKSIHQAMSSGSSTLVIKNAKQGDADRYSCFAANNIDGEKHSSSIDSDLKVLMKQN